MLPAIDGIAVTINGDIQASIQQAGKRYREKYDAVPSHVSLPKDVDPATVDLYGVLQLARNSGPGVVIVGRAIGDTNGAEGNGPALAEQMEL